MVVHPVSETAMIPSLSQVGSVMYKPGDTELSQWWTIQPGDCHDTKPMPSLFMIPSLCQVGSVM